MYQVRRIAPDLTASWYEVHYGPVKWNGEVIAVTFVTTDISEYKWAETKLSESKEELRPLFDDAHYLILKIDHNANILSTNRTMPCFIVEKIAGNTVSGYISTESQQKISQLEKKNCFLNNLHFSPAQIKVANLVRQDKTTREIADLLGLSEKTIQDHRKNIRKKLRITNKKVNLKFYLKKRSNNIPVFD